MIGTTQSVQIWIAAAPVDMRKSFDGLAEHVRASWATTRSAARCSSSATVPASD